MVATDTMEDIPHANPPPPPLNYVLDYPKDDSLTWESFHPPLADTKPPPQAVQAQGAASCWQHIAAKIQDLHARFAAHNEPFGNPHCSGPDRRAVLSLYCEALAKLEHTTPVIALRIHVEVMRKAHTILGLRPAEPDDDVFYTKDAVLSPLEPQYAEPRLDFYDSFGEGNDRYYWAGYTRLQEWRKGGWPKDVPWGAVQRERREREWKENSGMGLLRETAGEALMAAFEGAVDWGEEVDADPARSWA